MFDNNELTWLVTHLYIFDNQQIVIQRVLLNSWSHISDVFLNSIGWVSTWVFVKYRKMFDLPGNIIFTHIVVYRLCTPFNTLPATLLCLMNGYIRNLFGKFDVVISQNFSERWLQITPGQSKRCCKHQKWS